MYMHNKRNMQGITQVMVLYTKNKYMWLIFYVMFSPLYKQIRAMA
jgi:hypothetical protein